MNKRLEKRHKRQVSRAKEKVRVSEPDLRTPEQIKAAREASRAPSARGGTGNTNSAALSFRGNSAAGTGSAAKTDA